MQDVSGDGFKPGPDGHIRHPTERDLVWWEFADGTRAWVRQSRWSKLFDIKTEQSTEIYSNVDEPLKKKMTKYFRDQGIRYKVRMRPFTDWNSSEGPWEYAG